MKVSNILFNTVLLAGLLSSCSIFNKSGVTAADTNANVKTTTVNAEKPKASNGDQKQLAPLLGCWSVVEINGEEVKINGENHPQFTFESNPDIKSSVTVIAFNGCNYLNGSWLVKGDKLQTNGEFITSLRACPDAPYEFALNKALNDVDSYSVIDAGTISLNNQSGRKVMLLRKRNLAFLNGAWKVTSINGEAVPNGADVKIVIDIDNNKLHGRAGCNIVNGSLVVNLDKGNGLEFKDLATTMMMCPFINTEREFLLALEEVAVCNEGANSDEAIMKSNSGKTLLKLTRISADELSDD